MRIDTDMTTNTTAALKSALKAAIQIGDTEIDLSAVNEIDMAGLQVLLIARHEAASRDAPLRIVNPSQAVRELFTRCRLTHALDSRVNAKA